MPIVAASNAAASVIRLFITWFGINNEFAGKDTNNFPISLAVWHKKCKFATN
jgi:hypothetical protein